jgi:hypothetical protein
VTEERCAKLGERLSGYHDGRLDPAARAEVESHLRGCAACRARLEDYAAVDRAILALGAPALEDRLREELVAFTRETIAVRGRATRRRRLGARLRTPRTWIPLAAAALVMLVVWRGADRFMNPPPGGMSGERATRSMTDGGSAPPSADEAFAKRQALPAADSAFRLKLDMKEAPVGASSPPDLGGPPPKNGLERDSNARAREESEAAAPPIDQDRAAGLSPPAPAPGAPAVRADDTPTPPPASEPTPPLDQAAPPAGIESMSQPAAPAEPQAKAAAGRAARANLEAMSTPPPAPPPPAPPPAPAARGVAGRLDPAAALSIASLALEVGDLTGARLALAGVPLLPADTLTTRAAELALVLAARTGDSTDCKNARERADALTAALPSGATVDSLRARRAALTCPP